MNLEHIVLSEVSQSQKDDSYVFLLPSQAGRFIETESRTVVSVSALRGMGSSCSVGTGFQFAERSSRIRCTATCIELTVLNRTLQMAKMVKFMLHAYYHNKKLKTSTYLGGVFTATAAACGSSWARVQIRTIAANLHHSHSNTGSMPNL